MTSLIDAVRQVTGLPVQHYVEVNFEGFARLVDMVGGIDVLLPGPIRDLRIGLSLPAGQVHLDGRRSLQLVRARNVEELRSGRWVVVSTGDIDRISRQQRLLSALLDKMSHAGPLTLLRIARGLAAGTQVDDRLESRDMIHAAEA